MPFGQGDEGRAGPGERSTWGEVGLCPLLRAWLLQVLPTQLVPDTEGKYLRVRLIQKEGAKLFDPVRLTRNRRTPAPQLEGQGAAPQQPRAALSVRRG